MKTFLVKVTLATGRLAPYHALARSSCDACVHALLLHDAALRVTAAPVRS
ncbi:hypothetical protein [Chitinasiproducens palmae]|uniref:Uncharacterized protein n=1 Tax=Chitinasiproducens palmae TaxID=1770053 RepID=A0A1H2PPN4_9BURK|nr:hypothetical protein [Chitinasiproducens palmae]SDV48686.1 hypothetical protein SAMN05216551_105299 [Chitinasiproducens palmae]